MFIKHKIKIYLFMTRTKNQDKSNKKVYTNLKKNAY